MSVWSREISHLSRLSAPAALTQLGFMMTGVVDTLMLGRVGVLELGASALANMWQWTWMSVGLGIVMGTDPFITQAHGRGDGQGVALAAQRGMVVAVLVSLPIALAMFFTEPSLLVLGQQAEVAKLAGQYNLWKLPSIPAFLLFSALRQYLQGRAMMAPATWVMWVGNALNVALNWGLIFGQLGLPRLELDGAAIASSLTNVFWFVALATLVFALGLHRGAWRPWDRISFDTEGLIDIVRMGLSVGAQLCLEGTAFTLATMMAGWIGPVALAGHQIVLNMAALTFMVPLGVAQAATTRIGNLIGAANLVGMRRAAVVAILLGAGVMLGSAAAFTALRHELPRLYTSDPPALVLAASILPIAAAFQLFDGTQVVASGILRGMGRPGAGAVANLLGFYLVALPLGYWLAFEGGMGLRGLWFGLALGLVLVAILLVLLVRRISRQPLEALRVQRAEPIG